MFNNTNILNDTTILSLRYGWTTWQDQTDKVAFEPGLASLGFASNFVNAIHPDGRDLFPDLNFDEVRDIALVRQPPPVEVAVLDQRRGLEAVGQPHAQDGRRLPAAGDRDDDVQ